MAPKRKPGKRGMAPKVPGKRLAQAAKQNRDSSSGSSSRGSSRSDDGSSSSSDTCSDEDDPRDYKRGGYHPVTPYQLYNGRYRVLSKLGAGAFSTVWLCADEKTVTGTSDATNLCPELIAMKVCKSKKSVTEQALDEIMLFDRMQDKDKSPHVVQMQAHFWHQGPNGRHKCMVFEVMGENLLALVKHRNYNGVPLNMVRRLALHTLKGLEYIHAHGVIHTDVKLENVLVQRHDLAELMLESRRSHRAFMDQRKGMEALSKSQKKRMKKKQSKALSKGEDDAEIGVADEPEAQALSAGPQSLNSEKTEGMTEEEQAAAQACGRPVPPVRQRDRLDTLKSEMAFAKLADFGNGILTNKKVTDDIQTRQYRSPEVIIGADWDATADVWSFACMCFELITGDFLFDPRTGKDWTRDEDHLALMIELLGSHPPKEWALSGKYSREFFSNTGKLKHIKSLKFWSLVNVLGEKYSLSQAESLGIADFLSPMLSWEPRCRQSASDAAKHPWLQKWDDVEECARRHESGSDDNDDETSEEEEETHEKEEENEQEASELAKTTSYETEEVEHIGETATSKAEANACSDGGLMPPRATEHLTAKKAVAAEASAADEVDAVVSVKAAEAEIITVKETVDNAVANDVADVVAEAAAVVASAEARGKGRGNTDIAATALVPPKKETEDADVEEEEEGDAAACDAKKRKKKNKNKGKK